MTEAYDQTTKTVQKKVLSFPTDWDCNNRRAMTAPLAYYEYTSAVPGNSFQRNLVLMTLRSGR